MGKLINGTWHDVLYETQSTKGKFERQESQFRNWVTPDGNPGPTGRGGFVAKSGRYHLYISHTCPWAHRTLIFRQLKGLTDHISFDVVDPDMLDKGWTMKGDYPGATDDRLNGKTRLHQIYTIADPSATARVTVPILWDKETGTIVSNESAEIIRMLNSAFDELTGNTLDFRPEAQRGDIEAVNERVYHNVNNGVYKCGFASTQGAYDEAVDALFDTMGWLDERLSEHRHLMGET